MANVAGILPLQSGEPAVSTPIDFLLTSRPINGAGMIVTGRRIRTLTDPVTGAYTQALLEGSYWVFIPATPVFVIAVPAGAGDFPLEDIKVDGSPPHVDNDGLAILGIEDLRRKETHKQGQTIWLEYLVTPRDGRGGVYVFYVDAMFPDDGADIVKPDNVHADEPGRWIRSNNTQ